MYPSVLVITINSYYSKVPSTGTAVLLRSTVPTSACLLFLLVHVQFFKIFHYVVAVKTIFTEA